MDLLFTLATWHAYAKLRLHTDTTLTYFEQATKALGQTVRKFSRTTCEAYVTTELPSETAARGRRTAALNARRAANGAPQMPVHANADRRKIKRLNLHTYKWHSLGHYPPSIRRIGTTDSHSTQIVSQLLYQLLNYSKSLIALGRAAASSRQAILRTHQQK